MHVLFEYMGYSSEHEGLLLFRRAQEKMSAAWQDGQGQWMLAWYARLPEFTHSWRRRS